DLACPAPAKALAGARPRLPLLQRERGRPFVRAAAGGAGANEDLDVLQVRLEPVVPVYRTDLGYLIEPQGRVVVIVLGIHHDRRADLVRGGRAGGLACLPSRPGV